MRRMIVPAVAALTVVGGIGVALGANHTTTGTTPSQTGTTPSQTGTTGQTGTTPKPAVYTFGAAVTRGQEVPKPNAPGTAAGTITGTITSAGKLKYRLTFKGLSGPALAAHIHKGAKGKAGPVLVALCATKCKSPARGSANVAAGVVDALRKGQAYVNVHTAKNPAGEIRGQVRAK